ncbi:MAG: phenylpyruvate tautomerase MIF-related protein [Thioalkalispiraceae bacterium]|jgi:phenylpyruvate tautomerase PptA (4-oxalocrotonate tautomerase family)
MPYLKVQSNQALNDSEGKNFIQKASGLVAEKLGKPERYVMVTMEPPVRMIFAGSDDPAIFMELKSIGLSETQTPELSSALCDLAKDTLGVSPDRVYIEFSDAPRKMWGWNGATF